MDATLATSIADLERLRDLYYVENPNSTEKQRVETVKERALLLIKNLPASEFPRSSLKYHYACARILNKCIDYEKQCEEYLSKFIKFECENVEALVELGICLMKKSDLDYALQIFEYAYKIDKSSNLLYNLATCLRFKLADIKDEQQIMKTRLRSLLLSEEATRLDENNGKAWFSLGNSRFSYFFATGQAQVKYLNGSIEAYRRAIECGNMKYYPDLHLNLAAALRYDESFSDSLKHSQLALKYDPESKEASDRLSSINNYLWSVHEAVEKKGKLKPKRLSELLSSLSLSDASLFTERSFPLPDGSSKSLVLSSLKALSQGFNDGKVLIARIIAVVVNDQPVPCTLVVCDSEGNVCAVMIYNHSQYFGLVIGDSIVIAEPFLAKIENISVAVGDEQRDVRFTAIRVASPKQILKNGKAVKNSQVAMAQVKFSANSIFGDK